MKTIDVDISRYQLIHLSRLKPAPWNYKKTGPEIVAEKEKLRLALRKRGQIINLSVRLLPDGDFEVINGNHRLELFQEEGVEGAVCFNHGDLPLSEAQMIAAETNAEFVDADPLKLGAMLKNIAATSPVEAMALTLPWTAVEIEGYIKQADFDWQKFKENADPVPPPPGEPAEKNRTMVALSLPADLADAFKEQLKRFDSDADAVRLCIAHLRATDL